jgi:hypothetical protein
LLPGSISIGTAPKEKKKKKKENKKMIMSSSADSLLWKA